MKKYQYSLSIILFLPSVGFADNKLNCIPQSITSYRRGVENFAQTNGVSESLRLGKALDRLESWYVREANRNSISLTSDDIDKVVSVACGKSVRQIEQLATKMLGR